MSNRYTVQNLKRQIELLYISNSELNSRIDALQLEIDTYRNALFYLVQLFHFVQSGSPVPASLLGSVGLFISSLDDVITKNGFDYFD